MVGFNLLDLLFGNNLICVSSTDPPAIKTAKSSETQVGRMGVLQCDAAAVPTPEFEWYRDEKR